MEWPPVEQNCGSRRGTAEDALSRPYYEEGERLVAVLGWNSPKQLLSYRQQLLASSQKADAALEPQKISGVL